MTQAYLVTYGAVDVFCILMSIIILRKFTTNVGSEVEIRYFRWMTISFMGFILAEFIWVLGKAGMLPASDTAYDLIKILGTWFMPVMVYSWFCFAENKFKSKFINKRSNRFLAFIPIIILTVFYILSFKAGIIFKISENSVERGPGFNLSGLVNNIYGLAIVIHAIILYIKSDSKTFRNVCIIQIMFILTCTFGGFIDGLFVNTPVLPLTVGLSFIYLFINLQEPQIFSDALTGLNNRRSAEVHFQRTVDDAYEEVPLNFFMMDINNFKKINDTYAHLEGDKALCLVADVLRHMENKYKGFSARWGGDEFLTMILGGTCDSAEEFSGEVNSAIQAKKEELNLKYDLSVAVGHAYTTSKKADIKSVINNADKALYKNKKIQ